MSMSGPEQHHEIRNINDNKQCVMVQMNSITTISCNEESITILKKNTTPKR